jgi:chemotaxis protein CheX
MESKAIVHFVESVQNVFSTMLSLPVSVGEPMLREPNDCGHDVSGIVGMSGDVVGTVVISYPAETAQRLVELFIGIKLDLDHEDFADAIGEFVNMVAGGAKAKFEKRIDITCPSVVVGGGHRVFQPKSQPIVEIPCECDCGPFSVLVTMKQVENRLETSEATVVAGA